MKKINLIISGIGLMFFNSLKSQNAMVGIEFEDMNVAYIGIKNPVKIISVYKIDSISFNSDGGKINDLERAKDSKSITCNLTFTRVTTKGQEMELNIWCNGSTTEIKKIRVKRVPDPKIQLFGIDQGENIDKSRIVTLLSGNDIISAKKPDGFDLDSEYKVVKWTISMGDKGLTNQYSGTGSKLTGEAKEKIKKISIGQKIILEASLQAPDFSLRQYMVSYEVK